MKHIVYTPFTYICISYITLDTILIIYLFRTWMKRKSMLQILPLQLRVLITFYYIIYTKRCLKSVGIHSDNIE